MGAKDLTATEANRRLYAKIAHRYDSSEECVVDLRLRERTRAALSEALGLTTAPIRVLDACGGSGNVSLMLHELGAQPVTVDVSPEMLAIYETKAKESGYTPETVTADINEFLYSDGRQWDLIVFSSALHHLDHVERVLDLAASHLTAGGVLVTMFDPTPVTSLGQWLRRLDYWFHVMFRTPGQLPSIFRRRLGLAAQDDDAPEIGNMAERHALTGLDDMVLVSRLRSASLSIIRHDRYYEGRFAVTRWLFRALRLPSTFALMARKPA